VIGTDTLTVDVTFEIYIVSLRKLLHRTLQRRDEMPGRALKGGLKYA